MFDTPEIPIVLNECRRILKPASRLAIASLALVEPEPLASKVYRIAHRSLPNSVDYLPIYVARLLQDALFRIEKSDRLYVHLPSGRGQFSEKALRALLRRRQTRAERVLSRLVCLLENQQIQATSNASASGWRQRPNGSTLEIALFFVDRLFRCSEIVGGHGPGFGGQSPLLRLQDAIFRGIQIGLFGLRSESYELDQQSDLDDAQN